MTDWFLRDESGSVWSLASLGTIAVGSAATIVRNGMAMSLGNDGDTVQLISPTGSVSDEVTYSAVGTDEVVSP